MIWMVLWAFTSNWAVQVGYFPNPQTCAMAAVQLADSWNRPPRPFLYRLACLPQFVPAPTSEPTAAPPSGFLGT